ncbi:hypothetical protein BDV95DRAFT_55956 [Massariosphaeria phaeospora]|uniref:Uncharacterized protein n=1 Tax=Massariosphaeria phaeospora TaxID=100035 RepID=A0A7C8I8Y7_9PLEO|nr:hypothetical protein BDV95DRAFT_55956 [Massariosphaeria phaeospora]
MHAPQLVSTVILDDQRRRMMPNSYHRLISYFSYSIVLRSLIKFRTFRLTLVRIHTYGLNDRAKGQLPCRMNTGYPSRDWRILPVLRASSSHYAYTCPIETGCGNLTARHCSLIKSSIIVAGWAMSSYTYSARHSWLSSEVNSSPQPRVTKE